LVCDIGGETLDPFNAAIERVGHVTQRAREFSDFVASAREVGNFNATANAAANTFGTVGETTHRTRDGAGEQHRQHDHDAGGDEEHLYDREPLGFHHVVDVGALCRQHQRATNGTKPLHGHRDGNDDLTPVVDTHHAGMCAVERLGDFLVALSVFRTEFVV